MKDSIIISTISKIHSNIVNFFAFIFLSFVLVFFTLQSGVYLQDFAFANINIKNLYLKWDNRLRVHADSISIKRVEQKRKSELSLKSLTDYTPYISSVLQLFDSISISKFSYNSLNGSLHFKKKQPIDLKLSLGQGELHALLKFSEKYANIHIKQFKYQNDLIYGDIYTELKTLNSYTKLHGSVNRDADFTLYGTADTNQLDYNIVFNKPINHPKEIVNSLNLPDYLQYWVHDAITVSNIEISKLYGKLHFNDLENSYKTLFVKAKLNKLQYKYNQKIEAVKSLYTLVELKNGVLYIWPKKAKSYGFDLEKSWLKIDLAAKNELLSLFLKFSPSLNDDILNVLQTYRIKIPVKQNSGTTKTTLTLLLNLQTLDTDVHGHFFCKKGNFHYLGEDFDVTNGSLSLNNFLIDIDRMEVAYKDIATAKMQLEFNAKNDKGLVKLDFSKLSPNKHIQLGSKPLRATYHIIPRHNHISIDNSLWLYDDTQEIAIDKVDALINIKDNSLELPTTYFSFKEMGNGFISGKVDLSSFASQFDLDLLELDYNGLKSTQSNMPFKVNYLNNNLSIQAIDQLYMKVSNSELVIDDFSLTLSDELVKFQPHTIKFGAYTKSNISIIYDINKSKGDIDLKDFTITNPNNGDTLYYNDEVSLTTTLNNETIAIDSDQLDAHFILNDHEWYLELANLTNVYKNSDLLQKYHITNGRVDIYKKFNEDITRFYGSIEYPYKLLMAQGEQIQEYNIDAKLINNKTLNLKVNEDMNISIDDKITVDMNNLAISLPETLKLIESLQNNDSNSTTEEPTFELHAKNSAIYLGDKRHAAADLIDLQYHKNILTAQLLHKEGKAGFKLDKRDFHLYGEGFGDKFMENLFLFSKFKGGDFAFNIKGSIDQYGGTLLIENSKVKQYTVLNNVLAFINTVPSLITFSVPGYSNNGIFMDHAFMQFNYKDDIYNIKELYVDSKELKISAEGDASIKNDTVDMRMNLTTDIASNISKIPVVGYIVFDGKALTTSVKINGKLSNPNVDTEIVKEVIVAPFNIIKRTLELPFKIFQNSPKKPNETSVDKKTDKVVEEIIE